MTFSGYSQSFADDAALRRRLLALARHWLHHKEHAEDLVQDIWLRAANAALPDVAGSREAWLITALRHLCIDDWRRQSRYQGILEQFSQDAMTCDTETPEQLAEQAQRIQQALHQLTRVLPAGDVAMVLLYEVFDFSHTELGELSGRSEAASRQHLRRTLQRLQRVEPDTPVDNTGYLLALCQMALAQRDPAGLIAVLRTSRPQTMARSARPSPNEHGAHARPPTARLLQIDNLLVLLTHAPCGLVTLLPLGQAITESA